MDGPVLRILGEIRLASRGAASAPLGAQAQRLLLALALRRDQHVHRDVLNQAVWGDDPDNAERGSRLRMAVSRLRQRLAEAGLEDAIQSGQDSYRLTVAAADVDADVFAELVAEARRVVDSSPDRAAALLEAALDLWPDPAAAFGSLDSGLWGHGDAARLEELRLSADEDWAAIELGRGREAAAVDRLQAAARSAPLREVRWIHLATALYRSGRQAEALRAIEDARTTLREEVGVEPGPDLRRLEQAILEHHQTLVRQPPLLPGNLVGPAPIGRDEDLAAVGELLRANRVVSVVGLGGVGKTMLARTLAAASDHTGGTPILVGLDGLTSASEVLHAIAARLGLGGGEDDDVLRTAVNVALQRTPLLVLDGAESSSHAVAAFVDGLTNSAPGTRVLVTARAPIGATGEVRYALTPLATGTPDAPGPAVSLFLARAGIGAGTLDAGAAGQVVRLCERAAGLPLAIELIASALDRFGLGALDVAQETADDAVLHALQTSLSVVPTPSRDLLFDVAQLPDGVTLEFAAELANVEEEEIRAILGPLAQLRLVDVRNDLPTIRYRSAEPVRQAVLGVGTERADAAARRVAGVLLDRVRAFGDLTGIVDLTALGPVEAELGNLRHWLARSIGTQEGLELAIAASPALVELGFDSESFSWVDRHRTACAPRDDHEEVRTIIALANSAGFYAGPRVPVERLEWAAATAERLEDWPAWAFAIAYLAVALAWSGDIDRALAVLEDPDGRARLGAPGMEWFEVHRQRLVAFGMVRVGWFDQARKDLAGIAEQFDELGDPTNALATRYIMASAARLGGDVEAAGIELRSARELAPPAVRRGLLALVDAELSYVARAAGDPKALDLLATATASLERAGNLRVAAVSHRDLGRWSLADGDRVRALRELRAAVPVLLGFDRRAAGVGLAALAELMAAEGPDAAAVLAGCARRWIRDEDGPAPAEDDVAYVERTAERFARSGPPDAGDDELLALVLTAVEV